MSDRERLVQFELLGQEHTFYTASSEEEMGEILSLVRNLVELGPADNSRTLPVSKVAILACLNIASRYVRLEREFKEYRQNSGLRIGRLNEEINTMLSEE